MSKEYWVKLPLAGVIAVNIKSAESEEDAIEQALNVSWDIDFKGNLEVDMELDELDTYDKLVTGNVMHAPLWEAEAEEN